MPHQSHTPAAVLVCFVCIVQGGMVWFGDAWYGTSIPWCGTGGQHMVWYCMVRWPGNLIYCEVGGGKREVRSLKQETLVAKSISSSSQLEGETDGARWQIDFDRSERRRHQWHRALWHSGTIGSTIL